MWILYVLLYIVLSIIFTQSYKIATKTSKNYGTLTVLLKLIAGCSILLLTPCFKFKFKFILDFKTYIILVITCIFYAISDRMNTTVRSNLDASTFSIIKQLSTVFMIISGLLFFKEPFVYKKIIGSILIVLGNIIIFYNKEKKTYNKYVLLGIISNLFLSIALFLDVNISENFNLAFYVALTLLIPSLFITLVEKIKLSKIKKEFICGNKKIILITGLSWSLMLIVRLKAYELGDIITVAPLCALTVIGNVFVESVFFNEKNNLLKKIIVAILVIIGIFLINM